MEDRYEIDSVISKGNGSRSISGRLEFGSGLLHLCDDSIEVDEPSELELEEGMHQGPTPYTAKGDIEDATAVARERAYFRKQITEGKIPPGKMAAAKAIAYGLEEVTPTGVLSEGLPADILRRGGLTPKKGYQH